MSELKFGIGSVPSTPASGYVTLYPKADKQLYYKDEDGTETGPLGSGGGGSYTDEEAQDAVGGILTDSSSIDFTYNDGVPSITADLKATTVASGTYGNATTVSSFDVDFDGRLTGATGVTIAIPSTQVTDFTEATQDVIGALLVDSVNIDYTYSDGGNSLTTNLTTTTVASGTYGSASQVGAFTVDAFGRLTGASGTAIAIASTAVTDFTEAVQDVVGAFAASSTTITPTYNDAGNAITWSVNDASISSSKMTTTGVASGTYGSATQIMSATVDAQGRITGASGVNIAALQSMWVPAAAMRPSAASGCAALALVMVTAGRPNLSTLDFDATNEEFCQFWVAMPKRWNEGTVAAQFYWSHASTTTNFGVSWNLQGVAISDDDTLDAAFGTAQTVSDTGGTTNNLYVTSATSAITIAGSPAAGDMVCWRLGREPQNASDTMAIDARLHGVKILYSIDTIDDT